MSNDNNPSVTISKADLDSLVANLIEARACIEVATSAAARNNPVPPVSAEANTDLIKTIIGFVWDKAMEYAQDYVYDEMNKDIDIDVHIDETIYDSMTIHVRGAIEQNINLGEHVEIELPSIHDTVGKRDEVLNEFLEYQKKQEDEALAAKAAALAETVDLAEIPTADTISHVADPHNQLAGVKVVGNINLSKNNA